MCMWGVDFSPFALQMTPTPLHFCGAGEASLYLKLCREDDFETVMQGLNRLIEDKSISGD